MGPLHLVVKLEHWFPLQFPTKFILYYATLSDILVVVVVLLCLLNNKNNKLCVCKSCLSCLFYLLKLVAVSGVLNGDVYQYQ